MHIRRIALIATLLMCALPVLAAPPVAVTDTRTVPVNLQITINVIDNDTDPDGDAVSVAQQLASAPANGQAGVNADGGIWYIPNTDFVGRDSFSYTLVDSNGELAIGAVNITVSDQVLQGAAQRRNTAQIGQALDTTCNWFTANAESVLSDGRRQLSAACALLLESDDEDAVANALAQIAPEETLALMRSGARTGAMQSAAVSSRVSTIGSGANTLAVNGVTWAPGQVGGAGAGDPQRSPIGVFASVMLEDGSKQQTEYETGYESSGQGFTVGADYPLNGSWYIGGAYGFTMADADYQLDTGSMETAINNFFIYTLWQSGNLSFDGQLGYGITDYDIERRIVYNTSVGSSSAEYLAEGKTSGSQVLMNAQIQYSWNHKALTVLPYAKINYNRNTIKGYAETNGGGFAVELGQQRLSGFSVNAGFQSQYVINRSWGVWIPSFDLDLTSDINAVQDDVEGEFIYAAEGTGKFTLKTEEQDNFSYRLGVGSSFIFPNGLSGFFSVQRTLGVSNFRANQYQLGFRVEL